MISELSGHISSSGYAIVTPLILNAVFVHYAAHEMTFTGTHSMYVHYSY